MILREASGRLKTHCTSLLSGCKMLVIRDRNLGTFVVHCWAPSSRKFCAFTALS